MEPATFNNGKVDIVNYLAILSLEKIGVSKPTEKEIGVMEKILSASINQGINFYSRKNFKRIPQLAFSMLKKKRKNLYEKQYGLSVFMNFVNNALLVFCLPGIIMGIYFIFSALKEL